LKIKGYLELPAGKNYACHVVSLTVFIWQALG